MNRGRETRAIVVPRYFPLEPVSYELRGYRPWCVMHPRYGGRGRGGRPFQWKHRGYGINSGFVELYLDLMAGRMSSYVGRVARGYISRSCRSLFSRNVPLAKLMPDRRKGVISKRNLLSRSIFDILLLSSFCLFCIAKRIIHLKGDYFSWIYFLLSFILIILRLDRGKFSENVNLTKIRN